jgi:hypothetical protein
MDKAQARALHQGHEGSDRAKQARPGELLVGPDGQGEEAREVAFVEIRKGEIVEVRIRQKEGHDEEIHRIQVEDFAHGKIRLVFKE